MAPTKNITNNGSQMNTKGTEMMERGSGMMQMMGL